mmetsp:Transcript_16403/g.48584  ORF Transcript_16403/g.48584 Transcript_16403/m.48584 type:complete len:242 (-) Transcript_16403:188-913(-)
MPRWPLPHPSPSHARRLHVVPSARGARALEPERLVVEAVGVGVVEADGLGVVAQDGAVVLREGGAELVRLARAQPRGERLDAEVGALLRPELSAEEEEGEGAEGRLHPLPGPDADLEERVGAALVRQRRHHVVPVEAHRELEAKDERDGCPAGRLRRDPAGVVRRFEERRLAGPVPRDLHDAHARRLIVHVVHPHDVTAQPLARRDQRASLCFGHEEEHLAAELRDVPRHLPHHLARRPTL